MNLRAIILFLFVFLSLTSVGQLTPVEIAERNKPGTVMVQSTFKGTVSIIQPIANAEAVNELVTSIRTQVAEGQIPQKDFWHTYIMALCKDIDKYMMKGTEVVKKDLDALMIGSGFIITPDGYLVTNCHVVDENDQVTQENFAMQAFEEIIEADLRSFEETTNHTLTEEESTAFREANAWYFSQTLEVGDIDKTFKIIMGITGKEGKIVPVTLDAKLIIKGEPIPGKDVAILKLPGNKEYPTTRIGDDKKMRVGEQVYALGYPGVATFHPLISEESIAEATLTRGIVSARKTMRDGWQVIQTDVAITHGNSGGPVFNDKGEVIGLATFGSSDEERGQEVQGMNFIVPTTVVQEFIKEKGIKPAMSKTSLLFEQGLEFFHKGWYKKALEKFRQVKKLNATYPFVDTYLNDTSDNLQKGLDKEPDNRIYFYIGGGLLLVILIVFIGWIYRRNKRRAETSANSEL
jgi:S1-C subfamily serine protease